MKLTNTDKIQGYGIDTKGIDIPLNIEDLLQNNLLEEESIYKFTGNNTDNKVNSGGKRTGYKIIQSDIILTRMSKK